MTDTIASELGIALGDDPRQVLDLYLPRTQHPSQAVLAFVHGGGFRRGAPSANAYQGRAALEAGVTFAALGYRLVPEARFPDSAADIESALLWLRERFGPDAPIYLSGHSAGAMLAALVALRRGGVPDDLVRGLVLISGFYDFSSQSDEVMNRASSRYVPSLLEAIERVPPHTIVVVGEHDFPTALPAAEGMRDALQARGASVEYYVEPEADHFQANRSFIDPAGAVFGSVRRMMHL